ncbi:MAG: thiazole synthase [Myxococcales bacterium]|nr:thiazole synthase [Myxococcales bacterium]
MSDRWRIGAHEFESRLIVGTGKYASVDQAIQAIRTSGAEMVTVAVRRVDLSDRASGSLMSALLELGVTLLPNTAGCHTADEAVRTAKIGRELAEVDLVKLEVIGCQRTLFPDMPETLKAAQMLLDDGFTVLPYITDDPVMATRLAEMGCAAVMPLGAPIGSGLGLRNPYNIRIIMELVDVPVIVDAGVGTASDAAVAMELGCSAVLMNTGIAGANDPVLMASAMRNAVLAGRQAFRAGRIGKKLYATASSPLDGLING